MEGALKTKIFFCNTRATENDDQLGRSNVGSMIGKDVNPLLATCSKILQTKLITFISSPEKRVSQPDSVTTRRLPNLLFLFNEWANITGAKIRNTREISHLFS